MSVHGHLIDRRPRGRSVARLVAVTAIALMTTSVVALGQIPAAHAAGQTTDYGFSTFAFGTKVKAAVGELRSGRTAPTWIGCTRQAGQTRANKVLAGDAPANNPLIQLGTVTSRSSTFKRMKQGIAGGTSSTSTIASIRLGTQDQQASSPHLTIIGLTTTATAWATRDGQLHASTDTRLADIDLVVPPTGSPLDDGLADLLALVDDQAAPTLDELLALLKQNGGIDIPGLGRLERGYARTVVGAHQASAVALSLRMTLYGANGVAGGGDDSTLQIGRSFARILDEMNHALMGGAGWAADADLLGDTAHVGNLAPQQLPCQGTDGKTRTRALASAAVPGVTLGTLRGRSNGLVTKYGAVKAWTEGSVAHVALGSGATALTIDGVVGRVNLATNESGGLVRRDIVGTIPGVLAFQGKSYTLPLGSAPALPAELAALVKIETGVTDRSHARALEVTALRITVLGGSAAGAVINLGNARASIRDS